MRDLLVQAVVYASLPLIPFRPFLGLLVFSWLAYMRPQDIAWGIGSERFSYLVALATLLGLVLAFGRERIVSLRPQTLLLTALLAWVGITVYASVAFEPSRERYILFSKIILISLLTTGMLRTRERYRALIITIAFSLGLLGLKYGMFGLLRGGAHFKRGPGGFMMDNNGFALALNMAIPLLVGIAMIDKSRLLRLAAVVLTLFSIITVFFTFSRGGFLTLGVVGALLLLRSGRPWLAAAVLVLGLGGVQYLTSERFQESYLARANTIAEYEEDSSAMGRILAWQTALRMSRDYPLFGVGPANFMRVYPRYGDPEDTRVAHNAFLQSLTDSGLPALVLFASLLVVTLWRLELLRLSAKDRFIDIQARMIQISIAAYVAGSLFLDKFYYDLVYHLIGITVGLEVIAASPDRLEQPTGQKPARRIAVPWWRQPRPASHRGR